MTNDKEIFADENFPMTSLKSFNPATNTLLKEYPEMVSSEWQQVLSRADLAFQSWKLTTFAQRSALMRRAADLLGERKNVLAELMALEMGKPLAQGRAEIEKCADTCRFYADRAQSMLTVNGG